VREVAYVSAPVALVLERVRAELTVDGLSAAVSAALAAGVGHSGERPSGERPSGERPTERGALSVLTSPMYFRGQVAVLPMRWFTSAPSDESQPTLDGNLEVEPADSATQLTLIGIHRFGASLSAPTDSKQQEVARATARGFLSQIVAISAPRPAVARAAG
jgi:hypothetical protein